MNKKAVGYIRVSTEEQAIQGLSLEAQEEQIRLYCQMMGLELVGVIRDEGVSGAKPLALRKGGIELLKKLASGVGHVVTTKLDRLFRDAEDALHHTKMWDQRNITLHILDLGGTNINTNSAMGRFFLSMLASMAELERNLISERTALVLRHKKSQREVYGTVPYGFSKVGDKLVVNEKEMAVVRQIFEWRKQGWTLTAIANELNKRGIPTKESKKKKPPLISRVQAQSRSYPYIRSRTRAKKWYPSTVQYILKNDLYKEVMENAQSSVEA